MKDKIYTIPVTDAFREDCECPFCALERKLEEENIDYFLGGALMEPDCRQDMNEHGFCKTHLDALFDSKKNALGLGLILTSYLNAFNKKLDKEIENSNLILKGGKQKGLFSKKTETSPTSEIKAFMKETWRDCAICNKLDYTMKRYISVFFHMWKTEKDFKEIFKSKKGFCNMHFLMLIEEAESCLNLKEAQEFLPLLYTMQIQNFTRLQKEVEWFTEKFDYKNQDAPWGNSQDAVQRSIEKLK